MFDGFAEEYERHAADGAYNAWYDRPAVLELIGDVTGQRVLDAGCRPGFSAAQLLASGAEVVAFARPNSAGDERPKRNSAPAERKTVR